MTFLGLTPEDYPEYAPVEVWPDNWPVIEALKALGDGSWNMGPNGPVGFRREAFREIRLGLRIPLAEWPELFELLCIAESEALDEIYKD
jgi:hypothetical protein